jgi:polysaccharide export outer membrane protein
MFVTVRGVSDWLRAKPYWFLPIFIAGVLCPAYGQTKFETQQQTNDKIQQLATVASTRPPDRPVGSGDVLQVDVFDVPELSRQVRVSDSGDIGYPLVPGKISVAGMTAFQVESKLEQLLVENGLVAHPQVSVFVKEQNSEPVSVVGAVAHTMVYQVLRPTTLLEVLSAAGGISDDAGSVVIVTRPIHSDAPRTEPASATNESAPDEQKITIRLQDLLESGDSVYNIPIYGGDTVTVPHAGIVYVLGFGIAQPGGYVLQSHGEQVTVLKAVALAHGLTGFARADDAVIMRTNPATGGRDQIPVHLKQIENHKADDVPLKSNDVLYVPDSSGKKILARGAEAALGVGTGIAIYRSP